MVLISREDKEEPIYRPTTLNSALYDFYAKKCFIYAGPPEEGNIILEYDLFIVCASFPFLFCLRSKWISYNK